jgi:alpha-ketoglutarate-dependent taurine dioxygenase
MPAKRECVQSFANPEVGGDIRSASAPMALDDLAQAARMLVFRTAGQAAAPAHEALYKHDWNSQFLFCISIII